MLTFVMLSEIEVPLPFFVPAEGRFSEKPHANENGHVRKSVSQSVSQSQRANQKRERTGSRMIPDFFGGSYDVSHQKKM